MIVDVLHGLEATGTPRCDAAGNRAVEPIRIGR
jgi:hypothetical protein